MPTYDYVCEACDHRFERFQNISEKPIKRCPKCGKPRAKRRISSGAGLLFKGSGFYATDYRKGPAPSGEGDAGDKGGEKTKRKKDPSSEGSAEGKES